MGSDAIGGSKSAQEKNAVKSFYESNPSAKNVSLEESMQGLEQYFKSLK